MYALLSLVLMGQGILEELVHLFASTLEHSLIHHALVLALSDMSAMSFGSNW